MMKTEALHTGCFAQDVLRDFNAARLEGDLKRRVGAHLRECRDCRRRVGELDTMGPGATLPALRGGADETEDAPPDEVLSRGTQVGRFVVLHQVGEGGMGVVYAGFDPLLERKVALKVVRLDNLSENDLPEARARLLREAQSIARLTHPNVVTVFEAGPHEGGVFVAMEFVDGQTLHDWTCSEARGWRELLRRYVPAARGLAAAHAAGLVHRDFKPDNVLVGKDGRVRVVDFGLARAVGPAPSLTGVQLERSGHAEPLGSSSDVRTAQGLVVGTPAYMAPEQIMGHAVDARSDQYAFCVSLWEALYGTRPFVGKTFPEVLERMDAQQLARPLRSPGPKRLRRLLLRGLAFDPEKRHASMEALARELERVLRANRLRLGAQAAALGLTIGLTAVAVGGEGVAPCTGADEAMAETWSSARANALLERWTRANPNAPVTELRKPLELLDRYAGQWTHGRTAACESTVVHGEQPESLMVQRLACFDRRLRELGAVARALEEAPATAVGAAVEAAASLPALSQCDPAEVLAAQPSREPPPALVQQVAEVREELVAIEALRVFDAAAALARVEALAQRTSELAFLPVQAEVKEALGVLRSHQRHLEDSERALEEAVLLAERAGHPEVRMRAEAGLARVLGFRGSQHESGWRHMERAMALLEHLGRPTHQEVELVNLAGTLRFRQTRYAEAERLLRRAHELQAQISGPDHPRTARLLNNVAQVEKALGKFALAEKSARRSVELLTESAGEQHRWTQVSRYSLSTILLRMGRSEEALAELRRTYPHFDEGRVEDGAVSLHLRVAVIHLMAGRVERAGELLDLVAAWLKEKGSPGDGAHDEYDSVRVDYLLAKGELPGALRLTEARRVNVEKLFGTTSPARVTVLLRQGLIQLRLGDARGALRTALTAREAGQGAVNEGNPLWAEVDWLEGEARLELGEVPAALALLRRALETQREDEQEPVRRGVTQHAWLRALQRSGAPASELREARAALEQTLRAKDPLLQPLRQTLLEMADR